MLALGDAAIYITKLPKAEQDARAWQTAAELLLMIAERGGDPMIARIAMIKALHRRDLPDAAQTARRKRVKQFKIVR
ncbi:MAG: hypothetical protein ACXV8H_07390 [Chthoniobacterales bacterium]